MGGNSSNKRSKLVGENEDIVICQRSDDYPPINNVV